MSSRLSKPKGKKKKEEARVKAEVVKLPEPKTAAERIQIDIDASKESLKGASDALLKTQQTLAKLEEQAVNLDRAQLGYKTQIASLERALTHMKQFEEETAGIADAVKEIEGGASVTPTEKTGS